MFPFGLPVSKCTLSASVHDSFAVMSLPWCCVRTCKLPPTATENGLYLPTGGATLRCLGLGIKKSIVIVSQPLV